MSDKLTWLGAVRELNRLGMVSTELIKGLMLRVSKLEERIEELENHHSEGL